ncbi:putative capsid protein [Pacific flying fox faeces associated circular DNA virus-11]|nr:putative capsid protein [Pacific flying fox faeces associated circular DNA virus-11]
MRRNYRRRSRRRSRHHSKYNESQVFSITRKTWGTYIQNTASNSTFWAGSLNASYAKTFTLGDVPAVTEFTNLFEEYRIVGIRVTVNLDTGINVQPTLDYGTWFMWVDNDDGTQLDPTTGSNFDLVLQRGRVKTFNGNDGKRHTMWVKPMVSAEYYRASGGVNAYGPKYSPWLSTSNTGTPHYSFKIWVRNMTSNILGFNIMCKYYLQFRGVQ